MTWLDNVLATPLIGILIEPDFELASNYKSIVAPVLQKMRLGAKNISIKDVPSWGLEFNNDIGDKFKIDIQNIVTEYSYNISIKSQSGALPTLEYEQLQQFSVLIKRSKDNIISLLEAILKKGYEIKIKRIGVVARTNPSFDDLPPNIASFLGYLERPWENGILKSQTMLLANLLEGDEYTDRCHHHLNMDKSVEIPNIEFHMDWQRVYLSSLSICQASEARELLDKLLEDSVAYFNDFGGDFIDE